MEDLTLIISIILKTVKQERNQFLRTTKMIRVNMIIWIMKNTEDITMIIIIKLNFRFVVVTAQRHIEVRYSKEVLGMNSIGGEGV